MKIERVMVTRVHTCRPEDTLRTAAERMEEGACGCLPVVAGSARDERRLVGMLTEHDICKAALHQDRGLAEIRVSSAMTREPIRCRPKDSIGSALERLRSNHLRRLPVVDTTDRLVGLVSLSDVPAGEGAAVAAAKIARRSAAHAAPHRRARGRATARGH